MYYKYYQQFINSIEYKNIEQDDIYIKLREFLSKYLKPETFLEIEELLHEEIIFKLEQGFKNGFEIGLNNEVGE